MSLETVLLAVLVFAVGALAYAVYRLSDRLNDAKSRNDALSESIQRSTETFSRLLVDQLGQNRQEAGSSGKQLREELSTSARGQLESVLKSLEAMRETIQQRVRELQQDNAQKLDQMRQTVDEKLQSTLERRFTESFKLVSERLDAVQKGLGEMSTLATGVGNLSRLLNNVKSSGTWGEIQLQALLEDMLTKDQYSENVKTKPDSDDLVEFAIRLPGSEKGGTDPIWLPVDSKFPKEVYQRIVEARDKADAGELDAAKRELVAAIKLQAKKIKDKYVSPPQTTDFAILFLPTEGLYAEVMQIRGLNETVQRDHRIVMCGPSTLAAYLNALQMGFRTLAISKRSNEVWTLLGAIKTEFGKFGELLDATKKKLDAASQSIETAAVKSRGIQKKLKQVEEVPADNARLLLSDIEIEPAEPSSPSES